MLPKKVEKSEANKSLCRKRFHCCCDGLFHIHFHDRFVKVLQPLFKKGGRLKFVVEGVGVVLCFSGLHN